jgi:hypothetical protein
MNHLGKPYPWPDPNNKPPLALPVQGIPPKALVIGRAGPDVLVVARRNPWPLPYAEKMPADQGLELLALALHPDHLEVLGPLGGLRYRKFKYVTPLTAITLANLRAAVEAINA